jgi:hypothetical protein
LPSWDVSEVYDRWDKLWAARSACRPRKQADGTMEYFTDLFFNRYDSEDNARVEHGRPDRIRIAKLMCQTCEVKDACLVWALRHGVHFDFLAGGLTWSERKRVLHVIRWWARAQDKVVRYPWHNKDRSEEPHVRDRGEPLAAAG